MCRLFLVLLKLHLAQKRGREREGGGFSRREGLGRVKEPPFPDDVWYN